MKKIAIISSLVMLAACGRSEDQAPKPKPVEKVAPRPVAFDPAFVDLAGSWRSKPDSVEGGRYLQIDVASGGGYTIDVRKPSGTSVEVSETGRGKLELSGGSMKATPGETQGAFIKKLGAWSGQASKGEGRTMSLKGADGTAVTLAWQKL